MLKTAVVICVMGLIADFGYSCFVAYKIHQWEAKVERDENGVREGSQPFSLGKGKTALLLIHGLNDAPPTYKPMATKLATSGYHCRVMRLPGFGESVRKYAKANADDWLAKVDEEVKLLRQNHQQVYLVGHSLGGAITIAYVRTNPQLVDGVVLLAPAVDASNARSFLFPTRTWHEISQRILWFTWTTAVPYEADSHHPDGKDPPWRTPFSPLNTINETFKLIDANRGQANEIKRPVLMVLSYEDVVVDWQKARTFFYELGSSRKELFVTKDSGHMIPTDNDWPEVTDAIIVFAKKTD